MSGTPELDKMLAAHDDSLIIGEFLEWAEGAGYELVKNVTGPGPHFEDYSIPTQTEKVLAEYYDIDLDKANAEQAALAKGLAAAHNEQHRDTYTVHPPEEG